MLVNEFLNIIFLISFTIFWLFCFLRLSLGLWCLFFNNLVFLLLVEVCSLIWNIAKFVHLKEGFHPFSTLVKHLLFDTWLLSLLNLVNEILALRFIHLLSASLHNFQMLPLFLSLLENAFWNRIFPYSQKFKLLLSHLEQLLPSKKSSPIFLDNNSPLVLFICSLVWPVFCFISHFGKGESSHDSLPSSL